MLARGAAIEKYKEGLGPKQNIPQYAREKVHPGAAGKIRSECARQ